MPLPVPGGVAHGRQQELQLQGEKGCMQQRRDDDAVADDPQTRVRRDSVPVASGL